MEVQISKHNLYVLQLTYNCYVNEEKDNNFCVTLGSTPKFNGLFLGPRYTLLACFTKIR